MYFNPCALTSAIPNNKIVDIIQLGDTFKNQPRNNKGRYIHIDANPKHIDDFGRQRGGKCTHTGIAEMRDISLEDIPKTVLVPWNYSNFCIGVNTPNIEIEKYRGSVSIKGNPQSRKIFIGSPDPSQI